MGSDNRTVSTDALETLGTLIPEGSGRDAIHLAVDPAVAAMTLRPGEDVGFVDGGVGICDNPVGIVDPFLKANLKKGDRFWLVVYPRTITSLRHVWEHPAFPVSAVDLRQAVNRAPEPSKAVSEQWLRDFCAAADCPGYERTIALALDHIEEDGWSDEYLLVRGSDAHGDIPPEFWTHFEIVTGVKAPEQKRATYFSCSC